MKFGTIISVVFIIVAIILSVSASLLWYHDASEVLEKEVISKIEVTAQSRADQINIYLEQNIERLNLVTSRTALRNNLKLYNENPNQEILDSLNKILKDAKAPIQEFERICIISTQGIVLASTDNDFYGMDVSNKDFFIRGREKEVIDFVEEEGRIMIFVMGPIVLNGELIGVGITVIGLDYLKNIVESKTGLGNTGEVLVAMQGENERIYLFERLFEQFAFEQTVELEKTAEPMKQALLGNEVTFTKSLDYRNEQVLAVSRYIEVANLGLVAKIDVKEAFGEQRSVLIKSSFIIIIGVTLVTLLISLFIAQIITKPLRKITSDVGEITKGKLEIQLEKSSIFEIQSLIDSLNRILATMKLAILKTGLSKGELGLGEAIKAKALIEDKYKRLVENLGADYFFYSHDTKGYFTYVSPSVTKMLGYSPDDFLKHYSAYLTKNPINKKIEEYTNNSIKGIKQKPYLIEIYDSKKRIRTIQVTETPIFDSNKNVVAVEGIAHDITKKEGNPELQKKLVKLKEEADKLKNKGK